MVFSTFILRCVESKFTLLTYLMENNMVITVISYCTKGLNNSKTKVSSIPTSKRGRKLVIGDLDKEVMNFIYNLHEVGGVVNGKIAVAAAKGIINAKNREILVENGGHVTLGNGWVKSLFKRMNFVCRKKTTSTKPKMIGKVRYQLQRD